MINSSGHIYLVGFMGSGKSAVCRELARMLRRQPLDMDDALERRLGMPVHRFIGKWGLETFRREERRLLLEVSSGPARVIATGGGVPEDPLNVETMNSSGTMVFLDCSLEECARRVSGDQGTIRPLWVDLDHARALYEKRRPLYLLSPVRVCAEGGGPQEVARRILQELFVDRRIPWETPHGVCPIIMTWNGPEAVRGLLHGKHAVILTDETVGTLHLQRYTRVLSPRAVIEVPPGEDSKDLRIAQGVFESLLANRIERRDVLLCLGGGMVTDLGAFVASTYKRGICFVLASTTLLGCVDAAIGGKAAVNLGGIKNVVGLFTVPRGIVLDMEALSTLPRDAILGGIVEAYKTGLAISPELAAFVEEHICRLIDGEMDSLWTLVQMSARSKVSVVEGDFREGSGRMVLNLGHTVGHALEVVHGLYHGRAVAMGVAVECRISKNRGWISQQREDQILATLRRLYSDSPAVDAATLWEPISHDKKTSDGRVRFVLLRDVGRAVICDDVSREELDESLNAINGGDI
jgi:3-dehydroquinate synthetase/shikimate kinase